MAVVLENESDGTCKNLRLVAETITKIPQKIITTETLAHGKRLTDDLITEIAEAYAASIEPLSDLRGSGWYRKQIIGVLARRALKQALADS